MAKGQSTHLQNENEHKKDIGHACSTPSENILAWLCPESIMWESLGRNEANLALLSAVVAAIAISYHGSLSWEDFRRICTTMSRYHWRSWMVLMKIRSLDNRILEPMYLLNQEDPSEKDGCTEIRVVDSRPVTGSLEWRVFL